MEKYNSSSLKDRLSWFQSCDNHFTEEYAKQMSIKDWNSLPIYVQRILTEFVCVKELENDV